MIQQRWSPAQHRARRRRWKNNFGIRKRLLEYDDVMNKQRRVITSSRHNALFGERLKLDVLNMFHDVATDLGGASSTPRGDFEELRDGPAANCQGTAVRGEAAFREENRATSSRVFQHAMDAYQRRAVRDRLDRRCP